MSGPFGSSQWMYNASSGFYDFEISNSLRFDTASSTYLNRNSYTHDRQTFTYSFWFKPTNPSVRQFIFGRYIDGNNLSALEYDGGSSGQLSWYDYQSGAYTFQQRTTALFRDVSAWYHVVLRVDTTDGTAGNRARMYVNGTEQTSFTASTTVSQNVSFLLGDGGNDFRWGTEGSNNRLWYGGYLADITVIDGTSYAPTAFAETKNDIWIPKNTAGLTYGARGYRLEFKNNVFDNGGSSIGVNTGNNSTDLGSPAFTSSGLATGDSVLDSPTNNFSTYNSIAPDTTGATNHSFSEGNLKVNQLASSGAKWWNCFGTIGMPSGKYYWEHYALGSGTVDLNIGVCTLDWYRGSNGGADTADAYTLYANSGGKGYLYTDGATPPVDKGSSHFWTWGDVMGVAFDADTGKIWYAKNGTFLGSGDPAAGSNEAQTVTSGDLAKGMLPVFSGESASGTPMVNFGQDSSFAGNKTAQGNADGNGKGDFYYAPPSGYLALCTANMPDPVETIDPAQGGSPQDYVQTKLYTGNGQSSLDIDLDFSPDWVWIKRRTASQSYVVANKLSGDDKFIASNSNSAEETDNTKFRNFLTNSFRVGSHNGVNNNGSTYVSWNWKANGSGGSNTNGTINTTSTTVAAHGGFSISTYTGTGSNATVGHGLSSAPSYVIIKERNGTENWVVGFGDFTGRLLLDNNEAFADTDAQWRDTVPSSTVVTIGTHASVNRNNSATYVMYCFADVDGMQKSGTYTGNENVDGTFVYTGFRPSFILIKKLAAGDWGIYDNKRLGYNDDNAVLYPSEDIAEGNQASRKIDLLSNGFKLRTTNVTFNDDSTTTFLAFAEQSFKYSNAR